MKVKNKIIKMFIQKKIPPCFSLILLFELIQKGINNTGESFLLKSLLLKSRYLLAWLPGK